MGNHKFKLSDMIPNFRFYKLKYISRPKNKKNTPPTKKNGNHGCNAASVAAAAAPPPPSPKQRLLSSVVPSDQRKSYHFTRDLTSQSNSTAKISAAQYLEEPARLSSTSKRRSTKKTRGPAGENSDTVDPMRLIKNGVDCDPDEKQFHAKSESILDLAPIITKVRDTENHMKKETNSPMRIRRVSEKLEERNAYESESVNSLITDSKEQLTSSSSFRKSTVHHSPGMKLRQRNSPRLGRRNIPERKSSSSSNNSSSSGSWKSVSDNFAVVKSSADPQRDFRESMVEMIAENNIRASKDLEELLACYLSLNCEEYHDLIIKVFKQIWFDTVADIRFN